MGLSKARALTPITLKTGFIERWVQTKKPRNCVFIDRLRSAQFNLFSSTSIPPRETGTLGKGGLAQLVERLLCKQNVNGSNPLTSTIFQETPRLSAMKEAFHGIQMGL